jgi:RNase H-fold protein (predicted Holliday junction resolvase)
VSQNEYGTTLKAHISFLENNRKVIAANSDFSSNCNISFSHFNKQKDSLSAIEIIKLYFENKKLFLKNIMQCINN